MKTGGNSVWIMHLGKRGAYEAEALETGHLILGSSVNLSPGSTRDDVRDAVARDLADRSVAARANAFGIIAAFAVDIAVGDLVLCPMKTAEGVAVARVRGSLENKAGRYSRSVEWLHTALPRDAFAEDLRYKFSLVRTVVRVRDDSALLRVKEVIEACRDPGGSTQSSAPALSNGEGGNPEEDLLDLVAVAREQIEQRISIRFHGHEFTELIAAILRAQGYVARVSPPGPDNGIDIVAGRGELGFDPPKLVVQVKSGRVTGDQPTLQALIGSVQDAQADQGLLVCWSGFTQAVRKRTNELFFRIRLWDREEILNALFSVYDKLPEEIRAELPLQRTWTLVPSDTEPT